MNMSMMEEWKDLGKALALVTKLFTIIRNFLVEINIGPGFLDWIMAQEKHKPDDGISHFHRCLYALAMDYKEACGQKIDSINPCLAIVKYYKSWEDKKDYGLGEPNGKTLIFKGCTINVGRYGQFLVASSIKDKKGKVHKVESIVFDDFSGASGSGFSRTVELRIKNPWLDGEQLGLVFELQTGTLLTVTQLMRIIKEWEGRVLGFPGINES